jgi:hypothetical protein
VVKPQNERDETSIYSTYLYYTIYPKEGLSLSATAGPQKYNVETTLVSSSKVAYNAWSPIITATAGWQAMHTNISAGYSREIVAGNGLVGTYRSDGVNAAARWQALRTWIFGVTANYSTLKSVVPLSSFQTSPGGHSIAGAITVEHSLSAHFIVMFEYDRLHQSYTDIPVVENNPDSNREIVSIQWHFARPLGR